MVDSCVGFAGYAPAYPLKDSAAIAKQRARWIDYRREGFRKEGVRIR